MPSHSLGEIAQRFDLTLRGDPEIRVEGVCALAPGRPGRLAYLSDASYKGELAGTRAAVVIVAAEQAGECPVAALVADHPKLAYARVAGLFVPPPPPAGVTESAVVAADARVDATAAVGPRAVVSAGARLGAHAVLEAGCVIGRDAEIGDHSVIGANAVIGDGVRIGRRVRVEPAAVIGARGFGLVPDDGAWQPIPQLGAVSIGDDVEIGASCTIDRGAIEDTVLEEGVKLDDQVHIAHNCRIGAHTVIAGCTGIAGSTVIGRHCIIGGGVGISDHVTVADNVIITGGTQVPSDIREPGIYSSTLRAMPAAEWRKRLALLRKLDRMEQRLRWLERGGTGGD